MNTTEKINEAGKILNDLSSEITELNCYTQQMVAVACSFSGDYVDISDYQLKLAVLGNPDDYRNLFNAFCTLMAMVRDKAEELDTTAAKLAKEFLKGEGKHGSDPDEDQAAG